MMFLLYVILYLIIGVTVFAFISGLMNVSLDDDAMIAVVLGSIFWIIVLPIILFICILYKPLQKVKEFGQWISKKF